MNSPITARLKIDIEALRGAGAKGEYRTCPTGLRVRDKDVLFAIDGDGHLHLLLPVTGASAVREDRKSAGVRLVKHELIEGSTHLFFADLECTRPDLHATFHSLAQEVLEELSKNPERPDEVAGSVLASWRELLDRPRSGPLGPEQLAGLFAELGFLGRLVNIDHSLLPAWTGPVGQRHDFSFNDFAVEVKASLSSQKSLIRISGLEQLVPPKNGQLFLCHVRLEGAEGGESVPDKIDSLVRGGIPRRDLIVLLGKIGYSLEHEEEYRQVQFKVSEIRIYAVNPGFPRLTTSSFVGEVQPSGVQDISYAVNLDAASQFELAQDTWEATFQKLVHGHGGA